MWWGGVGVGVGVGWGNSKLCGGNCLSVWQQQGHCPMCHTGNGEGIIIQPVHRKVGGGVWWQAGVWEGR